jgi:anti-anti-sigma regulatory factor
MTELQVDDDGTLKIEGALSIFTAQDWCARLRALSPEDYPEITLDLSGLTEIDTAGIQLLLAFRVSHKNTRVHSCPKTLRDLIQQIGLERVLL